MCRSARRSTSTVRSAGSGSSTSSSSTRARGTGSWSVITSSTCSGARAHGSTGGFVMEHPMAEDCQLDQAGACPHHLGLMASIHGCGCEWASFDQRYCLAGPARGAPDPAPRSVLIQFSVCHKGLLVLRDPTCQRCPSVLEWSG